MRQECRVGVVGYINYIIHIVFGWSQGQEVEDGVESETRSKQMNEGMHVDIAVVLV
jgi:hypothetical protein